MSAGPGTTPTPNRDPALLAPRFCVAINAAIAECHMQGLDAYVFEGYRSPDLQALYYARGRTVIPPSRPVTNAPTNLYSWHGYALAVDVISEAHFWTPPEGELWFRKVADIFKQYDCRWGGDWKNPDTPHFQWALCRPSPSDEARRLFHSEGMMGVWRALRAV